ncbi:polycystin-1-like [Bombina bombina]|uniref:polycystin-1-like n=1 Tax=Bombina bombina TaxID=8345 RepID=UPI00235B061F|nr:polycystin-1-like [Bombina bombina]
MLPDRVRPMKWLAIGFLFAIAFGPSLLPVKAPDPLSDAADTQGLEVDLGCGIVITEPTEGTEVTSDDIGVKCFPETGGGIRTYIRCPPKCFCTHNVVNCSKAGLWDFPSAEDCPPDTITMDLSHNQLSLLRPKDLIGYKNLRELFLNQNHIQLIVESDLDLLVPLQKLDLSGNNLPCSCALGRLLALPASEQSVVIDQETNPCAQGFDATNLACADQYISCVPDSQNLVLRYSVVAPGPLKPASCLALCFRHGYSHYSLNGDQHCLCGSTERVERTCEDVCSIPSRAKACNKNIISDPHPAQVTVSLYPTVHCSLYQLAAFRAEASVPVSRFVWDFRDEGWPVSTTVGVVHHKYSLPGRYMVQVQPEGRGQGVDALVTVTMAVQGVELQCPVMVETRHSVEVWLQVQQGTNLKAVYEVHKPNGHQQTDDPSCPRGGRVFQKTLRCYWLSQMKELWTDAGSRCRLVSGGDLAQITSHEEIVFLQEAFKGHAPVWVNVSQSLRQVVMGSLDLPQEMPYGCMQLPLVTGADFKRGICTQRAPSLCENIAGDNLSDVYVYMLGMPFFSGADTENASLIPSLGDSQREIEVMLFPGLWFSHSGIPITLEFGVQPLQQAVQIQVQILRPFCSPEQHLVPPGCELFHSPYAVCHPQPLCNTTGGCPKGMQWCPLSESCLNLTQPCSTYAFHSPRYPPRYVGNRPSYSPVANLLLQLPPDPKKRNLQVLLSHLSLSVHPDDILAVQHNAEQGSLLRCAPSPGSPWSQSYISIIHNEWWEGSPDLMADSWVDNMVCDVRVTFTSAKRSLVLSHLLSGFPDPGTYKISAILHNAVSKTVATCEINVLSPVTDLKIVHPSLLNETLNVATHESTLLVISAKSSSPAHVQWSPPIQSTDSTMHLDCPQSLASSLPICIHPPMGALFAWTRLSLQEPHQTVITVLVSNEVSFQNVSLKVQSHEPIQGLSIQPDGERHIQLHQTQVFTAHLFAGSSAVFTWTLDNKEIFAYQGTTYKVTFRTPGSYKMKVHAQNPVSYQELEVPLIVGGFLPMQNPELLLSSSVFLVNESQDISFQIQVDSSSEVTISWDFGDDSPPVNRTFSPPYDRYRSHDPEQPLVTVISSEFHRYRQIGHYQLTVITSNNATWITCSKQLKVVHSVISLNLQMTPLLPLPKDVTLFSALCSPSCFAVTWSWNFGDGSDVVQNSEPQMEHTYMVSGFYMMTVRGNNGRSCINATLQVTVGEMVKGIQLVSSGTGEIGTETMIIGSLQSGTDVFWNFDMGDGTLYTNQTKGLVTHIYTKEGNFTVNVIVLNPLSSANGSLTVQVYKAGITEVFHSPIISSLVNTQFIAYVTMPAKYLHFSWDFGDGSHPTLVQGMPEVWHRYLVAGNYTLKVTVKGTLGSDSIISVIRIEDSIISVTLTASPQAANLSQPILFSTTVLPPPDIHHLYWYQWEFDVDLKPVNISSSEASWAYMSEGNYSVAVTVWNGVSNGHAWCHVIVQRPISYVSIQPYAGKVLLQNANQVFTATVNEGATAEFIWDFGDMSLPCFGQTVSHTYNISGNVTVIVYAQNNVSHSQESIVLSVLAPVTGLFLTADQTLVEMVRPVSFWTTMNSGDKVQYKWSLCESCPYTEGALNLTHIFSAPGIYKVSVQAENAVSLAYANISVEVQERVEGVSIHQEGHAVGLYTSLNEPLTLIAKVVTGSHLNFQWVVGPGQQEGDGPSITINPTSLGTLHVEVQVKNALGMESAEIQMKVIERINGVTVQAIPGIATCGVPVQLIATLTSGSEVQYSWNPGDDLTGQISQSPQLIYTYQTPGIQIITVSVSNALSSDNASTQLSVQESVSEVSIYINGLSNTEAIISHTVVYLSGTVHSGTNLQWAWTLSEEKNVFQYSGQNTSHVFTEPGQHQVQLLVWNNVSLANASIVVNVQDTITGLRVSTGSRSVCTKQVVIFSVSVQHGTNVSFALMIPSKNLSIDLDGDHGNFSFSSPGQHEVFASAYNYVSTATVSLNIEILESIEGLQLVGLQPAFPVNQTLYVKAMTQSAYIPNFMWSFQELGYPEYLATGQSVTYTPLRKGTLHVLLNATNHACFSLLSYLVSIQIPVTSVTLSSSSTNVFINQTVEFFAVAIDGTDLQFCWTFGYEEVKMTTMESAVNHSYSHPGDFVAQVLVYNLVSMVETHIVINVRTLPCEQPRAQLLGGPSSINRAVGAIFEVDVDLRGCTGYSAIYQWDVYQGPVCSIAKLKLPQRNTASTLLTIPGHTLDIGFHCLLFTVTLQGIALSHNVTHLLLVTNSPLVAKIHGGSYRTWPVQMDLILDGRESHDPDQRDGEESALQYEWRSTIVEGEGLQCSLPSLPPLPQVSISRINLCSQSTIIFTLTVRKPGRDQSVANQTVSLHSGRILVLSLRCVSCQFLTPQISRSLPVILSAECDACHNETQYSWNSRDTNGLLLTLDNSTTSTGSRKRELVIRRGVLQDGLGYTFTLRVTQQPWWGESSITLWPNNPPTGGHCSLQPDRKISWLETPLVYNCTGWKDPDMEGQLLYSLSVQICSSGSCQRLPLYRGTRSWNQVRSPVGRDAGEILVFVEIEDLLGARTMALNRTLLVSLSHISSGGPVSRLLQDHRGSLQELLLRTDIQVLPYSLEIITAINQDMGKTKEEEEQRIGWRSNITGALTSLHLSSLWDVAAISAALTQCVAVPQEVASGSWVQILNATEKMIQVLSKEGDKGLRVESETPRNILTLLGGALAVFPSDDTSLFAFNLTRGLMTSLMRTHLSSEEPLSLDVPGVKVQAGRVLPDHLLCSTPSEHCRVSLPPILLDVLEGHQELLQIMTEIDSNTFTPGIFPDISVSSHLVALEFSSPEGDPVVVTGLPPEAEIQLRLPVKQKVPLNSTVITLLPRESANLSVTASVEHRSASLHLHISTTLPEGLDWTLEGSPGLLLSWESIYQSNQSDTSVTQVFRFSPSMGYNQDFSVLLPLLPRSLQEYQVNVTSLLKASSVTVSISLFSSLCQYFHVPSRTWRSEGVTPSNVSQPHEIVCHTRHLTLFGASLFVPPHRLVLLPPVHSTGQRILVMMTCSLLVALYLLLVLISHKLDHLDVSRVGIVPLCGQPGRYKYWVIVKTGWRKGAGTTAHIGISLYGLVKSGVRHLDSGGSLSRGGVNVFQVETESNLGEVWKIRVWHDNTGLDPSWFLQYVAVLDKQTDFLYFFLVNDWLSVENERNGGRVEKELLAACPKELHSFAHVFPAQILLGFTDWHLWLSVWWRPARSRFTRVQRVTCCIVTLLLYIAVCAVWYGAVGVKGESSPLGSRFMVTWECVSVGILVSVMVLPLQLLFTFIFREIRSKVTMEDTSPPETQPTEQDICADASSLLSIPGGRDSLLESSSHSGGSTSDRLTLDLVDYMHWQDDRSAPHWLSSCDSIYDVPYTTTSLTRTLRRKKGQLRLGFESVGSSCNDPISVSGESSDSQHFTYSEENLIRSITAESDSGRFSRRTYLHSQSSEDLCSPWSEHAQWSEDRHWSDSSSCVSEVTSKYSELQYCSDAPSTPPSPFNTHIGVRWSPPGWLFPPWMLWVIYPVLFTLAAACIVVTVLYVSSLSSHGFLMWLISTFCSLLTSAVILEPLKAVLLSLCIALFRPPVLSEAEGLVEEPLVRSITKDNVTVRAPGGFSLLQAKEEARRIRALRSLIKSCVGNMVFFLLVLLVNYQSCSHDNNIRLLHTTLRQSVTRETTAAKNFNTIHSVTDMWRWLDLVLPVHLYNNPRVVLLGVPRLCKSSTASNRQIHPYSLKSAATNLLALYSLINCREPEPCISTRQRSFSDDYTGQALDSCQELGNSTKVTQKMLQLLKAKNWFTGRVLELEITQYHKDVHLYISTILRIDLSQDGTADPFISILPFHLLELSNDLNLPLALALSLIFAALCFLSAEVIFLTWSVQRHSPCWTSLLLGLVSGAAGTLHLVRTWLTKHHMHHYREHSGNFISLYTVAQLSRVEVALTAILLLLTMIKASQQLRFVRRWAAFGKTLQAVAIEILGCSCLISLFIIALAHSVYVATGTTRFTTLMGAFLKFSRLGPLLQNSPLLAFFVLVGTCLLGLTRRLLCASVLSGYRQARAESYFPSLEPQDYEMIDFLVKRFKLWLGLSKAKEFRHTVRFEGFRSVPPGSSPNSGFSNSCSPSVSSLSPCSSVQTPEELLSPASPLLPPNLAVEHLPQAVTDLLDRLDQVTNVLEEVSSLESKLGLWHKTHRSRESTLKKETSTSTNKQLQLPRTYSTFSESALTQMRSNVVPSSRLLAPESADCFRRARLLGATVSAGVCQRARLISEATRRPHSEERSGGSKRMEDPFRPVPLKRRAWDPEKSGDT